MSDCVTHLLDLAGSQKVLLLQYEKCSAEPQKAITTTFDFLGVESSYQPGPLHRKINVQAGNSLLSEEARLQVADYYRSDVLRLKTIAPHFDWSLWPDFH
jgi:hypothetical protein